MKLACALLALFLTPLAGAADWRAGAAKVPMTPQGPLSMAGFGSRNRPSEGTAQELYAKALALEDPAGVRLVLVTTDMLGFPASLSKAVAERVAERFKIPRENLLFNSSHTHCGPLVTGMHAAPTWTMTPKDWDAVSAYTAELTDKLVNVIGEALKNLAPARLSYGTTWASFGVHRRLSGGRQWGPNFAGPADHDVPLLRIESSDGKLLAVAFGYACHNSSLSFYKFHGDYAGSAQKWLEERHPGAVALFVTGCGGDIKAYPNGSVELTDAYGAMLGAAVDVRMRRPLKAVSGAARAVFDTVPLAFAPPPTREQLNERLKGSPIMKRHAEAMLKILDRDGHLPQTYPFPVQAWQFGRDLTLVAMGGEVVSEYALRLRKDLGAEQLWLAAYSNDVFGYIPSRRILEEGGYEAGVSSMEFYLQPGPWADSVEETVIGKVHEVIKRVRGE